MSAGEGSRWRLERYCDARSSKFAPRCRVYACTTCGQLRHSGDRDVHRRRPCYCGFVLDDELTPELIVQRG
jgi:hypothetical protein